MTDYSKMTSEDYADILSDVVDDIGARGMLTVPGVFEALSADAAIHNDVLNRWAEHNPDKAWPKFEVWMTQGQGTGDEPVEKYDNLEDALAAVKEMKDEGSFAIKYPDGQWHEWNKEAENERH